MKDIRHYLTLVENVGERIPVLFHGTCEESAAALLRDGWAPNSGKVGGNMGQARYLYLTNIRENALWFAEEKGCDFVVEVVDVPLSHLRVDPEDGSADSVSEELNSPHGLPGSVVLIRTLGPEHFRITRA
jgi:hypothetical protein